MAPWSVFIDTPLFSTSSTLLHVCMSGATLVPWQEKKPLSVVEFIRTICKYWLLICPLLYNAAPHPSVHFLFLFFWIVQVNNLRSPAFFFLFSAPPVAVVVEEVGSQGTVSEWTPALQHHQHRGSDRQAAPSTHCSAAAWRRSISLSSVEESGSASTPSVSQLCRRFAHAF